MASRMLSPRILIVVNADWYFWSHRLSLARALQARGCQVTVAASVERGYRKAIEAEGFRFAPLQLRRRSTAPWHELASAAELLRLYLRERPDLIHHITIKPVLYGSMAAKVAGIPTVVNTVPGLGYTFVESGLRKRVLRETVRLAYRMALSGRQSRVIFQNPDDRCMFVSQGLVSAERAIVIRGSGVDINRFVPSPEPSGTPVVLLASRLLWDKGVGVLVQASRLLKDWGTQCRVVLVGVPDLQNPNSVKVADLEGWQADNIVEWWGIREDMPAILQMSSIVTLPSSYREGVPKILLEAAASGRPIITTDTPGCREIVRHGENGLLVPPNDPDALAAAINTLLDDPALRVRMGARSRVIAETEFSEEHVLSETLAVYRSLLGEQWDRLERPQPAGRHDA